MKTNSKKETLKKAIFSAAMLNVLVASNIALATPGATPRATSGDAPEVTRAAEKAQVVSFEITSYTTEADRDWFDNDGCSVNNGCKVG